ncbi:MAG: aminotransferase class I/II-fold pyridoxal phosphate-dependent enzyme [Cyclobacteriaceae bacterium]
MPSKLKQRYAQFQEVAKVREAGAYSFFRKFESKQETVVTVEGHRALMFGSNSYLGLTTHPLVIEASVKAQENYGTSCSGSRFLNGTTDLHNELEYRIARFLRKEDAIVFSTGFQVNLGVLPTLMKKGDAILMDRLNHASLYEGARLSDATTAIFRHNDMKSLEKKLHHLSDIDLKLIAVDGIFSMEGNITRLPEIVNLAEKYEASVMVDCAHAVGVLGNHGRGTADHFGLTDKVDLIGGTFSKSLASLGGFVAGDAETIEYLKHHARSLIFSASMTPAATAAALAALDIVEKDDSHRERLWDNTNYALERLNELGFDTGASETPIIPIYVRDNTKTYLFTTRLFEEGIFVNPVVAPAVSPADSLIRFSLMATHSKDQIDEAISKMYKIAKETGITLRHKAA